MDKRSGDANMDSKFQIQLGEYRGSSTDNWVETSGLNKTHSVTVDTNWLLAVSCYFVRTCINS